MIIDALVYTTIYLHIIYKYKIIYFYDNIDHYNMKEYKIQIIVVTITDYSVVQNNLGY